MSASNGEGPEGGSIDSYAEAPVATEDEASPQPPVDDDMAQIPIEAPSDSSDAPSASGGDDGNDNTKLAENETHEAPPKGDADEGGGGVGPIRAAPTPTLAQVSAIINEVRGQSDARNENGQDGEEMTSLFERTGSAGTARRLEEGLSHSRPTYGSRAQAEVALQSDFDSLMEELGIDPNAPRIRSAYRYNWLGAFFHSTKFIYCLIVFALVCVVVIVAAAVSSGIRHSARRKHHLNPDWMVEQQANKTKDWWLEGNEEGETYEDIHSKVITEVELDELYYKVSDAYLPIWFDRSSGWKGQTYGEALLFCGTHDAGNFGPCPYEVYCPGNGEKLLFGEDFGDGNPAWAPISDDFNDWVQIGKGNSEVPLCMTYSELHQTEPVWGISGEGNEEMTRHILCCLNDPLLDAVGGGKVGVLKPPDVEKEHGEGVDDPILPPPYQEDEDDTQHTEQSLSPGEGNPAAHSPAQGLSEFEMQIRDSLSPFWFDEGSGWSGGTWQDAKVFCESISQEEGKTFVLCPAKAYCASRTDGANGSAGEAPLAYKMKPFEGVQWAPTSNMENDWIMIGSSTNDEPTTCRSYLDLFHKAPEFGLTGHQPEIKQHILCCRFSPESDGDGGHVKGVPQTGAGNSSPHTTSDAISSLKKTLKPVWWNAETGWSGGSHDDAINFCKTKDKELCPYAAYCPLGSTRPALSGHGHTDAENAEQYVPSINRPNQWILITSQNDSAQCVDYKNLYSEDPPFGTSNSMKENKQHILCCEKTHIDPHSSAGSLNSPLADTPSEDAWFSASDGWNSGSKDDALRFCEGKLMGLCNYSDVCPDGPSRSSTGSDWIGQNGEENEQWAPVGDLDDYVLVGMMGKNKATQCLTHEQMTQTPFSGDMTKDKMQHIKCCAK